MLRRKSFRSFAAAPIEICLVCILLLSINVSSDAYIIDLVEGWIYNDTAAEFGKQRPDSEDNRMNLFLPPSTWDSELCTVPDVANTTDTDTDTNIIADGTNTGGAEIGNRVFNRKLGTLQETRNMHRKSIALLIRRSSKCSIHTQALNALELDARFSAEANGGSSDAARNKTTMPKIEYIIVRNMDKNQDSDNIVKGDDEKDVDLYILGITEILGDHMMKEMRNYAATVNDGPMLDFSAFLPLDSPERKVYYYWFYPMLATSSNPITRTNVYGQILFIVVFLVIMFPLVRLLLYCCARYHNYRWRRNSRGWINGITWSRRTAAADEVRWMTLIGNLPTLFLRGDEPTTLSEEQVKSLPTIEYGKADDVNDIVQKYLSVFKNKQPENDDQEDVEAGGKVKQVKGIENGVPITEEKNNDEEVAMNNTDSSEFVKAAYDSCISCSICICEFEEGEELRLLPTCGHIFHTECILPWLTEKKNSCPLCQREVLISEDNVGVESGNDDLRESVARTESSGLASVDGVALRDRSRNGGR